MQGVSAIIIGLSVTVSIILGNSWPLLGGVFLIVLLCLPKLKSSLSSFGWLATPFKNKWFWITIIALSLIGGTVWWISSPSKEEVVKSTQWYLRWDAPKGYPGETPMDHLPFKPIHILKNGKNITVVLTIKGKTTIFRGKLSEPGTYKGRWDWQKGRGNWLITFLSSNFARGWLREDGIAMKIDLTLKKE